MNEKDEPGPFQGRTILRKRNEARVLFTKVLWDGRNEQTVSASRDNETISVTEPVTFRFRDYNDGEQSSFTMWYLESYDNLHSVDFCTLPKRRRLRRDYKLRGSPPLAYERNVSSDARNLTKFGTGRRPSRHHSDTRHDLRIQFPVSSKAVVHTSNALPMAVPCTCDINIL